MDRTQFQVISDADLEQATGGLTISISPGELALANSLFDKVSALIGPTLTALGPTLAALPGLLAGVGTALSGVGDALAGIKLDGLFKVS